ncbi:hypothetical protein YB2330_003623 [Saitoella coloradoensis]
MPHKKGKSGKSTTDTSVSVTSINGYSILPILTPTPTNPDTKHYLYVREHVSKLVDDQQTETDGRVLFAVNLPIDSTEQHLKALFASLVPVGQGRIESVKFAGPIDVQKVVGPEDVIEEEANANEPQPGKKRKRDPSTSTPTTPLAITGFPSSWNRKILPAGSTAHITFLEPSGLQKVLHALTSQKIHTSPPLWGKNVLPPQPALGLARYQAHHTLTYPPRPLLQATADATITSFESRETARALTLRRLRSEPDADGFVTVTRGSRTAPARALEGDDLEDKKKKGELHDFYRFQLREKKREKMMELRRRFEEDKERVRDMREKRRFRPY